MARKIRLFSRIEALRQLGFFTSKHLGNDLLFNWTPLVLYKKIVVIPMAGSYCQM